MRRRLGISLIILLACAMALSACRKQDGFFGGTSYDADELSALLESMKEQNEDEADDTQERVYYFVTGSGDVYHSNAACGYLQNSSNVISGTLSEVLAAGKERLCSNCVKAELEITENELENEENSRSCYYTPGGSVWHYDRSCVSLLHSENVKSGTVAQAMLSGKTRACVRCGE